MSSPWRLSCNGRKLDTRHELRKKLALFGQHGTKLLHWMIGECFQTPTSRGCVNGGTWIHQSIIHRFYKCPQVQRAWEWAFTIPKWMQSIGPQPLPWKLPSWEQCTFDNKISKQVCNGHNIWVLLKGFTLWFIWFEHKWLGVLHGTVEKREASEACVWGVSAFHSEIQ